MSEKTDVIKIFEEASREAGKLISREFGKISESKVQSKDLGDFVTTTDLETENILLKILKKHFPHSSYLTEESGVFKGNDETIVIDPIDGTTNFIHGIPSIGIVIGRVYNGEITDGVIFNPISNEFYFASKDKGAWCNDKKLMVSGKNKITNCLIGATVPHANRGYKNYLNEIDNIAKKCAGLRCTGSAAIDLTFVASGKTDAFWQRNLNIWDMCSGVLLVREAGGKITQPNGEEWTIESSDILASNHFIHKQVQENFD
jgi:myo-inositol-1(or 4)-monophosphatase|tara:strand:+ start:1404 stop:2180 length:777 start_codon:yes stop_codon:yes gene_type:complete